MKKITKSNIKYFFKYQLTKPARCIYNAFLFIKYPFLQPRNVWTGKKYWDFSEYSYIASGWRKAFGKQFKKDLRKALIKDGILKTFEFTEIKEKYGTLRLYNNGEGPETAKVINRYELLSMGYCFICGKPARYETKGWIEYMCEKCFDKVEGDNQYRNNFNEYKLACRLTKKDIPHCYRYEGNEKIEIDTGIDFYKLWDLPREEK